MPKSNPYFIPKENFPKTEQVIYLDQNYQPQSYEEFMKTYEPDEKVEIITEAEWQDRVLRGSQYGPGAEQSKTVVKAVAKTAVAVTAAGAIVATAGAATPFVVAGAAGVAVTGEAMRRGGKNTDNELLEWVGDTICSTGINVVTGGLSSVATGAVSTSKSIASDVASVTVKNIQEDFEYFSLIKDGYELKADYIHAKHKDEGISYKSDCCICNE